MDYQNQHNKIRQKIRKGDSSTLWEAINIAKVNLLSGISEVIVMQSVQTFLGEEWPQAFVDYFQEKVNNIANETLIPGNPKVTVGNEFCFQYKKSDKQ